MFTFCETLMGNSSGESFSCLVDAAMAKNAACSQRTFSEKCEERETQSTQISLEESPEIGRAERPA